MPTSWDQKRAQIAAALAGGNPPSVGAGPMVNPMIGAMSPQAPGVAGGSPGLMGAAPTQGAMMAQANASLQGAPGFDYVPPPVGPPPPPPAAPGQGGMSMDDVKWLLLGGTGPGNSRGHDGGGYSTSGRGGSGSSSSARGGGFRGF